MGNGIVHTNVQVKYIMWASGMCQILANLNPHVHNVYVKVCVYSHKPL